MTNQATALYTRKTFYQQPVNFRLGAIISDGMWYSLPKLRTMAKCTEEEVKTWIAANTEEGYLEQSPTGAKSFRFTLPAIQRWYADHDIELGVQLIDFLFPPRIWGGLTETDGFLQAPLRDIGIVSFDGSTHVATEVANSLRGIARVREAEPGRYKAYGLHAGYIKEIIAATLTRVQPERKEKMYSRAEAKRRELVDFPPEFARGLVLFYKSFGRTLVKPVMDTIKIFLPDHEDQESQITMWVLTAIEKFDESSSVPFSGYLNSVLRRWPYDLPAAHLGKDLSTFQRNRSRAIAALSERLGVGSALRNSDIADEMGMGFNDFSALEEKHKVWTRAQTATTLTWDENSDEKLVEQNLSGDLSASASATDIVLASKLSQAIVTAALESHRYNDAYFLISQIDSNELNFDKIGDVSDKFVQALGSHLGI